MNNALTADDIADLLAVSRGAISPSGDRRPLRASELDDNGARLFALGLVEVSHDAVFGVAGSARLGVTGAGLDELHERGL